MKLNYFQLEPHLAKQLATVYIVSGEELVLKQDAIKLVRKAAKGAGWQERIRLTPGSGFDWDELYIQLYSTSLFAEKRLLELDMQGSAPNKTASTLLQEFAKNPATDTMLLIDIGKIDDKIAKSAWYKALEKIGVVITVWPIPREQLPQWLSKRAQKYKLHILPDALNLLADYVEGNLIAAQQTLEKIYLLQPQQAVNIELIQAILTDESHFTVFDFIENLIAGNTTRALHILDNLRTEGTEPILILWAITRELRLLAKLAAERKAGSTFENLFQSHRIFARRQTAVRQFLTRFSAEDCWQHILSATHIDSLLKGASPGNAWESLQLFCLRYTEP